MYNKNQQMGGEFLQWCLPDACLENLQQSVVWLAKIHIVAC